MGFMTEISFLNDGWHTLKASIQKDPKAFTDEIDTLMSGRPRYEDGRYLGDDFPGDFDGLMRLGNGSTIYPSHHADDPRLLLAWRNSFMSLSHYDLEREFGDRFDKADDPILDALDQNLREALRIVKSAQKMIKEKREAQK